MPTSAYSPVTQGSLMKSASNNSINENTQNFTPDELTIKEMLKVCRDK